MKYIDFVNVRQGTNSVPSFSAGNILPITAVPFGMTSFAIETRGKSHVLFYNPNDHVTTGIRLTHCPSPWINDYANFTFMPHAGERLDLTDGRKSGFRPEAAVMTPYYIKLDMLLYRAAIELVPTQRGAIGRMTYRLDGPQRFILCNSPQQKSYIKVDAENRRIYGYTRAHTWPVPSNFAQYFIFEFDREFDLENSVIKNDRNKSLDIYGECKGTGLDIAITFAGEGNEVNYKLATSFISFEQAELNLKNELEGKTLEGLRVEARDEWEKHLSKIEIETSDYEQMKTFYTCMYRAFLFPRVFHEFDKDGKMIHYSPANGKICDGPMYTDNGFWDTYKTVYPLFSLILSDKYKEMCEAFLNFYDEAGWLPRWMSPGAVNCMPGTAIDAVFADAVAKGVVTDEKTIRRMMESTMKHATTPSISGEYGRDGIKDYLKYHYVTRNHRECVNKTLDYAYGDYCIATLARALGETEIEKEYMERALYYQNIFDPEVGFMRSKDKDGKMREDWTSFDWGGDYTEGSSWQNSWAVFQDLYGLAQMMGGRDKMIEKMDELFATPPYYKAVGYPVEIHEMTEMAATPEFGQCALSNQPSFHIPYIFACMGDLDKTSYWVRKACKELFNSGVNGYPGDEDNGSAACWYIFSSMGFYPVCPSVNQYVLGSPAVKRCVIHCDSGKDFVVDAPSNTDKTVYYRGVKANGQNYNKTYIEQEFIKDGGELYFDMCHNARGNTFTDDQLPYSISNK